MTTEEIVRVAPSVMQMTSKPQLSEKYIHVPTSVLIDDMKALGWDVVHAKQVRCRNNDNVPYVKHLVTFRNPNLMIRSKNGDDVCPQLLIINSHDGLSSFQFRAGIFRLVCSNGLVICTEEFGSVSVRHKGYSFEKVQAITMDFVKRMPQVIETLNKFTSNLDRRAKSPIRYGGDRYSLRKWEVGSGCTPIVSPQASRRQRE